MLDFPNNPVQGDIHSENGETWVYDQGAWVTGASSSGTVTEIVESGLPSENWQVWGDVLIQWGTSTPTNGRSTVVFPVAYDTPPSVAASARIVGDTTDDNNITASAEEVTATGCNIVHRYMNNLGNVSTSAQGASWVAIGEAPDALKKPKSVLGGSAGDTTVIVEDAIGSSASYQVVGDILVQWGSSDASDVNGVAVITFLQEFEANPFVVATPTGGISIFCTITANTTTDCNVTIWEEDGSKIQGRTVRWVAFGLAPEPLRKPKEVGGGVGGGGGGAEVFFGDDPPTDPATYPLWYKTSEPVGLYVYYDDGDSQQWVQSNGGGNVPRSKIGMMAGASGNGVGSTSSSIDLDKFRFDEGLGIVWDHGGAANRFNFTEPGTYLFEMIIPTRLASSIGTNQTAGGYLSLPGNVRVAGAGIRTQNTGTQTSGVSSYVYTVTQDDIDNGEFYIGWQRENSSFSNTSNIVTGSVNPVNHLRIRRIA